MVQVSTGGKTLITSAISVFLLLWVLLFAGPLFSDLPNAILASLIIVSLRGVLVQFTDLVKFGQRSYSEVFVWLATLMSTIFIDIDYGLMIGLGTSTAFLLWWGYYPKVELLGQTDHDDLFIDKSNVSLYHKKLTIFVQDRILLTGYFFRERKCGDSTNNWKPEFGQHSPRGRSNY